MYRITELDADTKNLEHNVNVLPNDALCSTQPII